MILIERWMVAAIVGLGLVSLAGNSRAQAAPGKHQKTQPAKAVQPDEGPPPDQAIAPDQAKPLDQGMPDPAPESAPDPGPSADQSPPPEEAKSPDAVADKTNQTEPMDKEEPVSQEAPQPAPVPVAAAQAAPAPATPGPPATPEEAQLQRDTAQLLRLVQELRVEVEKAGSNTLSLVALRKADEIQRLSKSLKERMRERGQVPQSRPQ